MTTLQDAAVGPASQNELICPARLAPSEPRAPIAILSLPNEMPWSPASTRVGSRAGPNSSGATRKAVVACSNGGGLQKKGGAGLGLRGGKPVSGMTTADLARDGMLTVTTNHRFGSARLTERGNWFARTLLC